MANLQETPTWEAGIYQLETSDPVMGGENGIDNRAPRQLANRTLWLKNELARQIDLVNQNNTNLTSQKADKIVQFTAGNGLTGGGTLQASRTLTLGTPSQITATSTNSVTATSHTHAIDKASTTTQGIVQLNSSVSSTSTTQAATPSAVKVAYDQATAANHNANGRVSKTGNETISGVKAFTDEITVTSSNALRFKNTNLKQSVFFRFSGTHFFLMKTAPNDPEGNWDASRPMVWDTTTDTLTLRGQLYGNATTANQLATPRTISATGDATWSVNFDGSNSVSGALTLTNTGVTAGSYNAVTVDAKGRVIRGLNQTISLVTATTASTTSNQATSNGNTYLNIVNRGAGISAAGSSTKITGTNGITVSSDASGALTISQDLANHLTSSSTTQALSAAQGKILNDTKLDKTNVITNPTLITDGDLNDYTQPGYYYCSSNSHAANIRNTPTNLAFCLQVVKASGVIQTVRQYSSSYTWMRGYDNGRWSSWQRFALTTDNAPTATKLATPRSIRLSGDVTASIVFDGSQDINLVSSIHRASTSTQGIVQLNSSVSSTSTTQAATPSAVKVAYDQATAANHNANGRVSKTGNETISGVKTFSQSPKAPTPAISSNDTTLATTAFVKSIANGTFSNSNNGYQILPSGLIIQWGQYSTASYLGERSVSITFPIAFPSQCLNVFTAMYMARHSQSGDGGALLLSTTQTGATLSLQIFNNQSIGDLRGFGWLAIGY